MDWQTQLSTGLIIGIVPLVIATIATLLTVFGKVLGEWGERFARRMQSSEKSLIAGLVASTNSLALMELIRDQDFVDSVLLLRGKDSGGLPQPGRLYTIESMTYPTMGERHPADSGWCAVLQQLVLKKNIKIEIDKLDDKAKLREFYTALAVRYVLLYYVGINSGDGDLYYVSVARQVDAFTPDQQSQIDLIAVKLRGLMAAGVDKPQS